MALNEKYVSSLAAGGGDGTTAATSGVNGAWTWAEMLTNAVAGDRCNVKSDGTYSRGTAVDTITGVATSTNPIVIRGYSATIGDAYLGRLNDSGPITTTRFPAITYTGGGRMNFASEVFVLMECLNISGAPSLGLLIMGNDAALVRSKVVNSGTSANSIGVQNGNRGIVFDCDISMTGATSGAAITTGAGRMDSCRVSVVSNAACVNIGTGTGYIFGNQIYSSGGVGIFISNSAGTATIRNNTIYGCTGDGINVVTGTTTLQMIIGNMITDNGGNGINMVSTGTAAIAAYNRTRDNTGTAYANDGQWLEASKYGDVTTDTGGFITDYSDAPTADFRLVSGSPAVEANFIPDASIGAIQRPSVAAGGSGQISATYGG